MIQIVNWWKYQTLSWATPSKYPAPDGWTDRERYNAKGSVPIKRNWDMVGGYSNEQAPDQSDDRDLPSDLPNQLPNHLPSDLPNQPGKGTSLSTSLNTCLSLSIGTGLNTGTDAPLALSEEGEGGEPDPFNEMIDLFSRVVGLPAMPGDIAGIQECVDKGVTEEDIRGALKWRDDNGRPPVKSIKGLVPGCLMNQGIAKQKAGASRAVPERKTDYMNDAYAGAYNQGTATEAAPKKSAEEIRMDTIWKLFMMELSPHVKNQIDGVHPLEYADGLPVLSVPSETVMQFVDRNLRSSLERQFMAKIEYVIQERETA